MTQPIKLKHLTIGEGMPKICVPITGKTKNDIKYQAERIKKAAPDLVEWRADFFEEVENPRAVREMLSTVHAALRGIPLLFTFRTKAEGGVLEFSTENYVKLNAMAAETKLVDAVDVEVFLGEEVVRPLIEKIHQTGGIVVGSNHHFAKTPAKGELLAIFDRMEASGADLLKIAVMPQHQEDVLTLLSATYEESRRTSCPLITMAMAGLGAVSRLSGEVFGSSITFAAVEESSAPGQMPIKELRQGLNLLHRSLQ